MQRRVGFIVSAIGMGFLLLPLSRVLETPDFMVCVVGVAFILMGIFFTIESVVKSFEHRS